MFTNLNEQYVSNGVVFVPRIVEAARLPALRTISEHCLCQWRTRVSVDGDLPWVGSTVMRNLNDPSYYGTRRHWLVTVLDLIADPVIVAAVREILGDEVLFRNIGLFMNPLQDGNDGHWHRDSQFHWPDPELEKIAVLKEAENLASTRKSSGIQLQIALVPSDHSQFVPGSHRRWDTEEEFYIRKSNGLKYACSNLMPGAVVTHQEPGDAAAFHHNGIHRGHYRPEVYRRTIMLTYTGMSAEHTKDEFSFQPWCLQPDYLEGVKSHTKPFIEKYIEIYRDFWLSKKQA